MRSIAGLRREERRDTIILESDKMNLPGKCTRISWWYEVPFDPCDHELKVKAGIPVL